MSLWQVTDKSQKKEFFMMSDQLPNMGNFEHTIFTIL